MTVPTPMEIAKAHIDEIRRLSQAIALQQVQLSRLLVGRDCFYKERKYQITLVTFSSSGAALIHGTLRGRTKKHPLGDLAAIELVK